GVAGDSRLRHHLFELLLGEDIAPDWVGELGVPGPGDGIRDVAFIVGLGVYVDFHDSYSWIGEVLRDPIGQDQRFRMCVICHVLVLLTLLLYSTCYIGFLTPIRRGPKSHNYRVKFVRRGGPGADQSAPAALFRNLIPSKAIDSGVRSMSRQIAAAAES